MNLDNPVWTVFILSNLKQIYIFWDEIFVALINFLTMPCIYSEEKIEYDMIGYALFQIDISSLVCDISLLKFI